MGPFIPPRTPLRIPPLTPGASKLEKLSNPSLLSRLVLMVISFYFGIQPIFYLTVAEPIEQRMENPIRSSDSAANMSQLRQPPAVGASQPSTTPKDRDAIFSEIYHYPWAQDSDFQTGFSSIAGDTGRDTPDSPVYHEPDLLLQAQCFYYARFEATQPQKHEKG